MKYDNQSQIKNTNNRDSSIRDLFTLKKFAEKHSSFLTLSSITNQVFKATPRHSSTGLIPGNGMLEYGVIVRIGRKVLIDEAAYFLWLNSLQNKQVGSKR